MRREMLSDWLVIFDDAGVPPLPSKPRDHGQNPFYRKGEPVVFGPYLYLQAASSFGLAKYSPGDVYNRFKSLSGLDQQYAGEVTGIMAALLAGTPHNVNEQGRERVSFNAVQ